MLKLRDYQTDLIDLTRNAMARGNRRILSVLPCGGGKTLIFAFMAVEHAKRGGMVHFYVHRKELLQQAQSTFKAFKLPTDNIYIGMVQRQTVASTVPTLIIFDEAHHATASQWKNITERYADAFVVGLTATPKRGDGTTLANDFDVLVEGVDANWLINNNYLAPYDYYAPQLTTLKPSDILINRGKDYDGAKIGDIMLKNKIYGDVRKYLHPDRKTIIYAPSVEFSKSLSILGVVHIDGTTPAAERDDIINKFRTGEIMHLTNVDLFGEGFDIPDCEVVILLRPTKSTVLFIQQTMRALRYQPNKQATIYDLVGNVFTHGLPTDYKDWELTGSVKPKHRAADEVKIRMCNKCFRIYGGINPRCPYCENDNGQTQAQIIEDQNAELVKIEQARKRELRIEEGRAQTLHELIELGIKRGYKNPTYWAKMKMKGRRNI